jgi:hypothetical protein
MWASAYIYLGIFGSRPYFSCLDCFFAGQRRSHLAARSRGRFQTAACVVPSSTSVLASTGIGPQGSQTRRPIIQHPPIRFQSIVTVFLHPLTILFVLSAPIGTGTDNLVTFPSTPSTPPSSTTHSTTPTPLPSPSHTCRSPLCTQWRWGSHQREWVIRSGRGCASTWAPSTSMTLRERKKPVLDGAPGQAGLDSARTSKTRGSERIFVGKAVCGAYQRPDIASSFCGGIGIGIRSW